MLRRSLRLALLALAAASVASAQDQGLDPMLFSSVEATPQEPTDVQLRSVQLYRIPASVRLRAAGDGRWGLRLTFPVSLSSYEVTAVSGVDRFVKGLGVAAIVPGLELEIPLGRDLHVRPFAEAGIGQGSEGGGAEVMYGAGVRARLDHPGDHLLLTLGASAMHRKTPATNGYEDGAHSTFEAGVDLELPLGFALGSHAIRGGVYGIARGFHGLELRREGQDPVVLRHQLEAGVSVSTAPRPRIWKLTLPWLGVGYQFGEAVAGVRIYVAFPF